MKQMRLYLVFLIAFQMMLGACAPKVVSTPPAPVASTAQTPSPTTTVPKPALPEEDWAKVVAAAKKEGRVTIYAFSLIGDVGAALADTFFQRYGIRADIIAGPAAGLVERIRTETRMKNVTVDVADFSASYGVSLLAEGNLVSLANQLPVLQENVWLTPPTWDEGGHIFRYSVNYSTPWVNFDMVTPGQEPKSYADLLDPKWRGKLLINDARTTTYVDMFIHFLTKYKVVSEDYFAKLVAQKLIIPTGVGLNPPYVALARGEGAILVFAADTLGGPIIAAGGHVKPVVTQEGAWVMGSAIQLINNAPHPNAGKLFINFVLSQEGQELVSRVRLISSPRKDVEDRTPYGSLKPFKTYVGTEDDLRQIDQKFREGVAAKMLGLK